MDKFYYDAIDRMQKLNVDRHFLLGWVGGYMDSYEAGYEDGKNKDTSNFDRWRLRR